MRGVGNGRAKAYLKYDAARPWAPTTKQTDSLYVLPAGGVRLMLGSQHLTLLSFSTPAHEV